MTDKEQRAQRMNLLAIDCLARLGNDMPNEDQIEMMASLLEETPNIDFNEPLVNHEIACLFLTAYGRISDFAAEYLRIKPSDIASRRKKVVKQFSHHELGDLDCMGVQYCYAHPQVRVTYSN